MSWADDEDDVPSVAVPHFQPSVAASSTSQPRPSLLAPSLPDRDFRDSRAPDARTPRAAAAQPRLADNTKTKGVQGQRDDIARIQRKLSTATGPVTTLADRMGDNPWTKSAAPAAANAAVVGTPRQSHAAPEPQRKPLVLAPRTQPLPLSHEASAQTAAPAAAVVSAAAPDIAASRDAIAKPSTPKSDPFGGAQPIDSRKAAETRQKLLEEKAKLDASRRSEVQPAHEQPAKQDKDMPRQQDDRPSSARGGWGSSRGRGGDRASDTVLEVKILQRFTEKLAISQPPSSPAVQSEDAPASSAPGRPSHGGQHAASSKVPTPREARRSDAEHAPRGKAPPKSPNLGPAAVAVVAAAAGAADGTPAGRGKGKKREQGGKGKAQGADDLPLPFDSRDN